MTECVALGYNFQGSWGDGLTAWKGGEGVGQGDDRKLVKVSNDELDDGKTPLIIIIIISIRSVKAGQLQNMKVKITGNSKNYFRQSDPIGWGGWYFLSFDRKLVTVSINDYDEMMRKLSGETEVPVIKEL